MRHASRAGYTDPRLRAFDEETARHAQPGAAAPRPMRATARLLRLLLPALALLAATPLLLSEHGALASRGGVLSLVRSRPPPPAERDALADAAPPPPPTLEALAAWAADVRQREGEQRPAAQPARPAAEGATEAPASARGGAGAALADASDASDAEDELFFPAYSSSSNCKRSYDRRGAGDGFARCGLKGASSCCRAKAGTTCYYQANPSPSPSPSP